MSMKPQAGKPAVTPERIMQFAWGYAAPLMLEAAVRHRVFDALDKGPATVEQLSSETGASRRGLRILLNALVGLELLARDKEGRYALTAESATYLVRGKPDYRGGMLLHTSTQLLPKWMQLAEIVRTGKPAIHVNRQDEGAGFFQQFVEELFPFGYKVVETLAYVLGVPGAQKPVRVLDLAAGSGVWGIVLAQKSPQVRVTAVDWPGVIDVTRRVAQREGVADRFHFVASDLHEVDFGTGHDIATLGHILHSEGETRSRRLLQKTHSALAPGGTIVIAEWLVNDEHTGPPGGVIFAVNMLVNTDEGDTFSFNEIRRWLEEAGFRNARTVECPGPSPLILATKK
jgi:ubiquinone/menaquinone biosynthesis C-methylase UbiE/DNA-binding transcriptional ArsR family regulator